MADRYRMGRLVNGVLVHAFDVVRLSSGGTDIENEDETHKLTPQERANVRLVLVRPIAAWDTKGSTAGPKPGEYDARVEYKPGTPEHFDWAVMRMRPFYRMPEGRSA